MACKSLRSDVRRGPEPSATLATAQLVQRYRNLLTGAEMLESSLRGDFPEYLNAEIVLRTIVDMFSAVAWLRSTYLYIRVSFPSMLPGLAFNMHAPFTQSFLHLPLCQLTSI